MYKTAISRAFLSTPSNHGCVKSSAIYILLGRMTFAISVIDYLRWRGGLVLAAGASHQMLCFLYFGDRWPPLAPFDTFFDIFDIFLLFSLFMSSPTNVSLARVNVQLFKHRCRRLIFSFCPSSQNCNCNGGVPKKMCTFSIGKVTSIEMRLCDKNLFSTFSLMSFLFRFCNS